MPDDVVLGKMRITKTAVAAADSKPEDLEKVVKLNEVDCYPPPGATADFVKPGDAVPIVLERFLQQEERDRLLTLGIAADSTLIDSQRVIGAILAKLDVRKLQLFYNFDYNSLLVVVPCFKASIYLRIRFDVFEIKVAANEDLTLGSSSFPKGDELASFRVAEPKQYRFEASYDYNPKCCPVRPQRTPEDKVTEWLPTEWKLEYDWSFDKNWLKPELKYNWGD